MLTHYKNAPLIKKKMIEVFHGATESLISSGVSFYKYPIVGGLEGITYIDGSLLVKTIVFLNLRA